MAERMPRCLTPAQGVALGAAAGIAGSSMIALLVRLLPRLDPSRKTRDTSAQLPSDPFEEREVLEWQDRSRSPAAYGPRAGHTAVAEAPAVTPAGALAEEQGPSTEGAAELFFVKAAAGLFDRDLSQYAKPAGKAIHFAYGVLGGAVYGSLQARRVRDPWAYGAFYGLTLWGIGPAWLVPAMHLMPAPKHAPKRQVSLLLAGHVIYGITLAHLFNALARRKH